MIRFISYLTEVLNPWIHRNSLDPTTTFLTDAILARQSAQDLLAALPIILDETARARHKASPIQGDLFFDSRVTNDGLWKKYYLKWYAKPSKRALTDFPATLAVINRHPDIHLAMLSILEPRATIHPHAGPWAGCIRVHIGLTTPNSPNCFISLNGQRYSWKDRELVAFDDTTQHWVVNDTETPRTVLFLDFERKMKSKRTQIILNLLNRTVGKLTTRE